MDVLAQSAGSLTIDIDMINGSSVELDRDWHSRPFLLEHGSTISWRISVETAGLYDLAFNYSSPHADKAQVLDINGTEYAIGFPHTGEPAYYRRTFRLLSGTNIVTLRGDWGDVEIGSLTIEPASTHLPTISPASGVIYRTHYVDIEIVVNHGGHRFAGAFWNGASFPCTARPYGYLDDHSVLRLPGSSLAQLPIGKSRIAFQFDGDVSIDYVLQVVERRAAAALTIAILDVTHGNSTFFCLPSGKTLLLDSGKEEYARSVVIPFLQRHGISKLDYYFLSHYHGDHTGLKDEIISQFNVADFRDYHDFKSGDVLDFEGVRLRVLNAFADGDGVDDNSHSLAFQMEYRGFVYFHGGDIYAKNQLAILEKFPNDIRAHVYNANHHFHGSVDSGFIRLMDPYLVVCSAEEAVYARPAYFKRFKQDVEQRQREGGGRLMEGLLTLESGTVIVRADDEFNWTHETYRGNPNFYVPYLLKE